MDGINAASSSSINEPRNALFLNKKKKRFEISDAKLRWQISATLSADQHAIAYTKKSPPRFKGFLYLEITEGRHISLNSLKKRLDLTSQQIRQLKKIKDPQEHETYIKNLAENKVLEDKSFQALDLALQEAQIIQEVQTLSRKVFPQGNPKIQTIEAVIQTLATTGTEEQLKAILPHAPWDFNWSSLLKKGILGKNRSLIDGFKKLTKNQIPQK